MKITPLDIDGHEFAKRLRGYDPQEVKGFLNLVSEEYEKVFAENLRLHEDVIRMESLLDEHRQRESLLQETLLTAQRVSEEIKGQARRESEIVFKEAELRAAELLNGAQRRAADLEGSLGSMRMEHVGYLKKARALLEHHMKLLELHEQAATEEEKVQVLRPSPAGTQ